MFRSGTLEMTEGKPLYLLSIFAFPLLIGNLFQQAYNLADTMIVGRLLGANSLAAVGCTSSISFLFFSFFNGICSGCGVLTARYFGARREEEVRRAIINSAYITLAFSLASGLFAVLLTPRVLTAMKTPSVILPEAITYMRLYSASVPFVAVYNYASAMQRALGDSKTPLYFLIVSCILNVGLDFLFVGPGGMGVRGAALATMLSQFLAGFGSLLYAYHVIPYFHLEKRFLSPRWPMIWEAVRLGVPMALQWSLIAVSVTALQSVVNTFGATAVAAYTATNRLEQLVMQPYGSLSAALSTYCGQNMGAGRMERIRAGFRDSLLAMGVMAAVMTGAMFFFGSFFVRLFVGEEAVVSMGARALQITSIFYIFLGIIYVVRGVLNGVGDAFFAFLNGIVEIIGRLGLPLLLLRFTSLGVWACWVTVGLTWMMAAVGCVWRYHGWKRKVMRNFSGGKRETTIGTLAGK